LQSILALTNQSGDISMSATTFNPATFVESFKAGFTHNHQDYYNTELGKFKTSAANLANQILADTDNKTYKGPVVIRHYHYGPAFWSPMFYSHPTVIITDPRAAHQYRHDKENENNALLGILATVVSGIFLYAIGSAIGRYQDASAELNEADSFFKTSNFENATTTDHKEKAKTEEAARAAQLKGRICNRIEHSALWDLSLRIAGFIGAASLAIGLFFTVPPLAIAGTCLLVASLGAMLFKWGLNHEDRYNRSDAVLLNESLHRLNKI
jgi:hypothetical protein